MEGLPLGTLGIREKDGELLRSIEVDGICDTLGECEVLGRVLGAPLLGRSFPLLGASFPLLGDSFPLPGPPFPLLGESFPLLG